MIFTTEKVRKKSETNKYIAIALIIYGVFNFCTYNWPHQFTTSSILGISQAVLLPILGTIILINSLRKIKQINNDFVKLEEKLLIIKSRGFEKRIDDVEEIKSIKINLDDIVVHYTDTTVLKIHLVDYGDSSVRKAIKQNFKKLYPKLIN